MVVIDDGSPEPLASIVKSFEIILNVKYYYKANAGPGKARNFGMERANGNYFIFLDSDTIVPENYMSIVRNALHIHYIDCYGGSDGAHIHFSVLQKAISFSMTSILTTGGIRGGKRHIGKFQPRSFNMGISKRVFKETGGFGNLRIGEDSDLSLTIYNKGFESSLIAGAKVYHKRRASLQKFARQVHEFGVARPILNQRHPVDKKLTFWLPSLFLIGLLIAVFMWAASFFCGKSSYLILKIPLIIVSFFFVSIFIISSVKSKNIKVGILSVITSLIQLCCYGFGFLKSWYYLNILKQKPEKIFPGHFYKDAFLFRQQTLETQS